MLSQLVEATAAAGSKTEVALTVLVDAMQLQTKKLLGAFDSLLSAYDAMRDEMAGMRADLAAERKAREIEVKNRARAEQLARRLLGDGE